MNEKLIKEYVKVVLQEGGYFRSSGNKKQNALGGWFRRKWNKFWNLFPDQNPEDKITKEWIEEHDLDNVISTKKAEEIISFAKDIYPKILKLSHVDGDAARAKIITRRRLDKKFIDLTK